MRRLPKMAAALLAAALAVSAALPALAADQRAELELEASVRCTGEAADETLTVRLTALDGAPMPEGCDDEAELSQGSPPGSLWCRSICPGQRHGLGVDGRCRRKIPGR